MTFVPGSTKISIHNPTDVVMSSTTNFNGAMPDGAVSVDSVTGRITFATSAADNGVIDPLWLGHNGHVRVMKLQLFMAGQSTWAATVEDPTSTSGVFSSGALASGTTETYAEKEFLTILSPGQRLKVVTTGGGTTSVKMVVTLVDARSLSVGARGF